MAEKLIFEVRVDLSDKARLARLKATGKNEYYVHHLVAPEMPLYANFVDLLNPPPYGRLEIPNIGPVDDYNPSTQAVFDAVKAAIDAKEAKKLKDQQIEDELVKSLAAQDPMRLICNKFGIQDPVTNPPTPDKPWAVFYPCKPSVWNSEALTPVREAVSRLVAAQDARIDAAEAAFKAAQAAERGIWIEQKGSTRLKRLVKEGIAHDAVYREERLALDYPGWRFDHAIAENSAAYSDARNCDMADFELLDKARVLCPDAKLEWCFIKPYFDEDAEIDHEGWSGIVATSEFDDKKIVLGCTAG